MAISAGDFERFRLKARSFLRAHEDRPALLKLKRNQPLTGVDLEPLEQMLHEAGGTDGDLAFTLEQLFVALDGLALKTG